MARNSGFDTSSKCDWRMAAHACKQRIMHAKNTFCYACRNCLRCGPRWELCNAVGTQRHPQHDGTGGNDQGEDFNDVHDFYFKITCTAFFSAHPGGTLGVTSEFWLLRAAVSGFSLLPVSNSGCCANTGCCSPLVTRQEAADNLLHNHGD